MAKKSTVRKATLPRNKVKYCKTADCKAKITALEKKVAKLETEKGRLEKLIAHDPLTGALSCSEFKERVSHSRYLCERLSYNSTKYHVSIVFIDIDRFKNINDQYGHEAGDYVLINLVRFLEKQLRKTDLIGRRSGDEFLLLLEESDLGFSEKIMKNIKSELKCSKLSVGYEKIYVDISYGIVSTSEGKYDVDTLLKIADERMYKNKRTK